MAKKKSQKAVEPALSNHDQVFPIVQRIIGENFRLYRAQYALAIFCMFVMAGTTAFSAYIIKDVVNEVFDEKNLTAAYSIAGLVLLIFFTKGMANFGQEVILKRIGNNIIARYQRRVYSHLLNLGVGYFADQRSAFLVGQINQNIGGIRNMLNSLVTVFARDLVTVIALVTVMVVQDPLMSLFSLVMLPIAAFVISRYVKRIKTLSRKEVNVNAKVVSTFVETVQGIPVVKAFTMEKPLQEKLNSLVKTSERQANSIVLINARTKPLTETLAGIAIAGSIAFGGWRVIALDGNAGALLSFLAAAMLAHDPAKRLASFRVQFEKSLVNARMLYDLLDTPPRQADKPDAKPISIEKGEVVFENVHFGYQENEPVLHGVSFKARAGQSTALVGPSGGGKSTIINLLLRFHDIQSGSIRVDGQDIADVKIASLRERFSYVSQQPVMFEGSIAENIGYGRIDATREEIEEAAKLAQAHDFIMETPQGYETQVGELGSNLSGGQRQRISIARAILRDAPILLLDEATSALDNESEKLVQEALDELMKGRTTLVIAHRLSTIRDCDQILVIDQGRITESGTHRQLLGAGDGTYAKLHGLGFDGMHKTPSGDVVLDDAPAKTSRKPRARKKANA